MHLVQLQPCVVRPQQLDAGERGIDRPVAGGVDVMIHPVDGQHHVGLLRPLGAADDPQLAQHQRVMRVHRRLVGDKGDQVVVVDFLLAVGQRLEPHEHVVQLVVAQIVPQIAQLGPQRRTARQLAHRDVGL